jgi:hypothetical protein
MEQLPVESVQDGSPDFIDVTNDLFNAVDNHLNDMEIVCNKSTFDFEDTMSSFELMDTKMDPRKQRHTVINNPLFKTINSGQLNELTQG